MTEYINMWKNYVNFTERTTIRGYWMAFLFSIIVNIIVMVLVTAIFGPMITITPRGDVELGTSYAILMLWSLASFLPMLAIQIRRLRDAGKRWPYWFIILIPFIGIILFIIALCKQSVPDDGVPVV